jgi:hypothetical protein
MIRKFEFTRDKKFLIGLPFVYEATLPALTHSGYVLERNGVGGFVTQDVLYPNDFPYLSLPREKVLWNNALFLWVTEEDVILLSDEVEIIAKNSIGSAYHYTTKDFVELQGRKMASIRRHVHVFENTYRYKISNTYDKKKVAEFIKKWDTQQKEKTISFNSGIEYFNFCLANEDRFDIKSIFVEVEGKLAGLAMGVAFDSTRWVGLHLKVDYSFTGLSRFLQHKRAELFKGFEEFTLGTECCGDEGIKKHKEELHPTKKVEYFFVMTGEKKAGFTCKK